MISIPLPLTPTEYEITLDGQSIVMKVNYKNTIDRFYLDVENISRAEKSHGIIMNVNVDLLEAHSRLGLQALVPVGFPNPKAEANFLNVKDGIIELIYMTLDEYDQIRYSGQNKVRELWV